MPRVLLLLPATSYRVQDFMAAASKLGIDVTVGSDQENVLADYTGAGALSVDFRDLDVSSGKIADLHARHPLSAIVGVDDVAGPLAVRASERLGLPHNPMEAVRAASDKFLFREKLKAAGLPGPVFTRFDPAGDPAKAAHAVTFPCVLKPTDLSASRGVLRADDELSFQMAFARIRKIMETAGSSGGILAEDYLPGEEVALEGMLADGKLITLALFDKPDPLEGPTFAETIYVTPSRHSEEKQEGIRRMTEQAALAMGLRDGPIHAELRLGDPGPSANERGPWMLEVAARSIGGLCSRALRFDGGLSLEEIILARALGRTDFPARLAEKATGVMMLPVPTAGRLEAVGGEIDARNVPGITGLEITIAKGQAVLPLPEGDKYLGFIFAEGDSPEAVETALRAAYGKLEIRIRSG